VNIEQAELRAEYRANRERYIDAVITSFVNARQGAFEDADFDATERAARRQWAEDNPLMAAALAHGFLNEADPQP
jgi:hypothetical protein